MERGEWSSIDLTIAAPRLASKIGDSCVLEVITWSDHRCIEFNSEQQCQAVDKGRGAGKEGAPPGTRGDYRERLRVHLETTRLIYEPVWVGPAGSLVDTVRSSRRKVVGVCN